MGHRRGWRRPVPVLFRGRNPDHITRPDFLDRSAQTLYPAATGGHDQGLAQRVGVPCGTGAGLEGDAGTENTRRSGRVEQRVNPHSAGKILCRCGSTRTVPVKYSAGPLPEGCEPLLLMSISEFLHSVVVQRPVICSSFSGYRAPCTVIFEAAFSMSRRASGVSSTETAPMFSSKRCSFVVPGIGTIHGFWASGQASAI